MRALVLAFVLAACAQTPAPSPPQPDYLSGTAWQRVDDLDAMPHPARMQFEHGRASGYTGCNRWSSDAVRSGGDGLRFENITVTERACNGAGVQMATEHNFLNVIRNARRAHYDQAALVLFDSRDQQIARFETDAPIDSDE